MASFEAGELLLQVKTRTVELKKRDADVASRDFEI